MHDGQVININVQISKPGAIHRARFMASCLYLLKICLYQKQFQTAAQNIRDTTVLGEYIALIHAPYFLKSPLAIYFSQLLKSIFINLTEIIFKK